MANSILQETALTYNSIDNYALISKNIKDFLPSKFVVNGSVDYTSYIQAAIDSFNPYSNSNQHFSGILDLCNITFKVSTIFLRNGVILKGYGTKLISTTNAPIIKHSANTFANGSQTHSAFGICGLFIEGSNTSCDSSLDLQDGIYLGYDDIYNSSSYSFIKNVSILRTGGHGIHIFKPNVSNQNFGWYQFSQFIDIDITFCKGYAILASGVTGNSDFSSNRLVNLSVNGCFTGGISLTGGNDNYIRGVIVDTGKCKAGGNTWINTVCDYPAQVNNQLNTTIDLHIENTQNENGIGLAVGNVSQCYTTSIRGQMYNMSNPVKIDRNTGCSIDDIIFLSCTTYAITLTANSRNTEIGFNWYKDISTCALLNDSVSDSTHSTTGYLTESLFNFSPESKVTCNKFKAVNGIEFNSTIKPAGETGNQTINKPAGSVNFAAATTSLVVNNSLVKPSSIILVSKGTDDSTARLGAVVAADGSFKIIMDTPPASETRVNFTVFN